MGCQGITPCRRGRLGEPVGVALGGDRVAVAVTVGPACVTVTVGPGSVAALPEFAWDRAELLAKVAGILEGARVSLLSRWPVSPRVCARSRGRLNRAAANE